MCFIWEGATYTLNVCPLELIDKFPYLDSSVSSTKSDVNMHQAKAWTAIDRLSKEEYASQFKELFIHYLF